MMKKTHLIIFVICFILLSGCSSSKVDERLYGRWHYSRDPNQYEGGWGDHYSYTFEKNGEVTYFECIHMQMDADDTCRDGNAIWRAKYKVKDNIIELYDIAIDEKERNKITDKLKGPYDKIIIDFEKMYFCNVDSGLDCNKKFEKDVDD